MGEILSVMFRPGVKFMLPAKNILGQNPYLVFLLDFIITQ